MKHLFIIALVFCCHAAAAQSKMVVQGTGRPSFKVGTLSVSNPNAFEKLKVQVFGGSWYSDNVGEATFYVAVREGIVVNEEIHGGSVSHFDLKMYLVNNAYDVVITVNADWPAFAIRSWLMDNTGFNEVTISNYSPTVAETPVTINLISATISTGKIGIGRQPDAKLSVKGDIHAEEVRVNTNYPGPDYVFEHDYHLPTLAQVEAYINQNHHLPEVPSAKQMEADGIKVSEINMLLLKKVEELTLYVIDLEKQVKELKKK